MIIQSRMQPTRVAASSNIWADDEGDDDPWSGYGDTLEMQLTPTSSTPSKETCAQSVGATVAQPVACEGPENEFAAAGARLQQREQDLQQQHLRLAARRHVPQYFPHLEQNVNFGHGLTGRGYAPTHNYTPSAPAVRYTPPTPAQHTPVVPQVIQVEPDPLASPQTLPYEIDAYGNPILPDGMELDAWGNLVPRNDYYNNY